MVSNNYRQPFKKHGFRLHWSHVPVSKYSVFEIVASPVGLAPKQVRKVDSESLTRVEIPATTQHSRAVTSAWTSLRLRGSRVRRGQPSSGNRSILSNARESICSCLAVSNSLSSRFLFSLTLNGMSFFSSAAISSLNESFFPNTVHRAPHEG